LNKSVIIPTIFSYDKEEFFFKLEKLISISKSIQIDFMDGVFVNSKSVNPRFVPDLSSYKNVFEAHLMVKNPVSFFDKIKNKGFKKVIFHVESFKDLNDVKIFFNKLKKKGIIPVVAINPDTYLSDELVSSFDFFLVMGVNPGKEKQSLIKSTYGRIRKIKKLNNKAIIQVDGGVNVKNSGKLFKAGANYLNSGSFISSSKDPKVALFSLVKEV